MSGKFNIEGEGLEAAARAVNAEPWDPPPGMVKRRCSACSYWFAALADAESWTCPDCMIRLGWEQRHG
jgi:hypothetical protein